MALIKCKECGHEVSDKASSCPNCGNPISSTGKTNKAKWTLVFLVIIACITYGLYYVLCQDASDTNVIISKDFSNKICKYEILGEYSEGYAAVRRNGKWGFIDTNGEEVIACTLDADFVGCFSEGKCCMLKDSAYYFIDKKGNVLFQVEGGETTSINEMLDDNIMLRLPQFKNDVCRILYMESHYSETYKILQIDRKGRIVKEEEKETTYKELLSLLSVKGTDFTQFMKDGLVGLKDKNGKVVVPAKYASVSTSMSNGVFLAVINEEGDGRALCPRKTREDKTFYGYVDLKGNETFTNQEYSAIASAINERERIARGDANDVIIEKERIKQQEKERRLAAIKPNWIQGTWVYSTSYGTVKVVIDGDNIVVYMNGGLMYNGSYEIHGDKLFYNQKKGGKDYIILDRNSQRLKADESIYFNKVFLNGSSSNGSSSSSDKNNVYSTDKGRTAYMKVLQLQKEVRALIERSAPYRGIMQSAVCGSYEYQTADMQNAQILNVAIDKQEQALSIAKNKLHDASLIRELEGQLQTLKKARYSD